MSRIVMFVFNDMTMDSRVRREAASLAAAGHQVTVMARPRQVVARIGDRESLDGFEIVRVPVPGGWRRPWRLASTPGRVVAAVVRRVRPADRSASGRREGGALDQMVKWRFAVLGWARAAADAAPVADVYHGHDLSGLPAAVRAAGRCGGRVVYDSHEYFVESGANARLPGWLKRRLARFERQTASGIWALVTVNATLATLLGDRLSIDRRVVVYNCPPRWSPAAPVTGVARAAAGVGLRETIGVGPDVGVVIYHGGFLADRGLLPLADALAEPGMATTHLVYLGFGRLRDVLAARARDPRAGGRIHVLEPVPMDALVAMVSEADVAAMPNLPVNENERLSTPNKLFESIAAGVPVVTSDFPERHRIVIDDPAGPLGAVCDPADPASIARAIRSILDLDPAGRAALRARCLTAAHERWNWETESAKLLALYAEPSPAGP